MDNLVGDYASSDDDDDERNKHSSSPGLKRERNEDGQREIGAPAKKVAGTREAPTQRNPTSQKPAVSTVDTVADENLDLPPPPQFDSVPEPFVQTSRTATTAKRTKPAQRQRNSMVPPQLSGKKPNLATEDLENMGLRPQKESVKKPKTRPRKPH